MLSFLNRRRGEAGFTMIELLVVVIIIAILAAVAVPVYIGIQNNAKRSSLQHDIDTTRTSVAAALAEDQPVASGRTSAAVGATVLNSHSPSDEIVEVTVNSDQSFTVTASSSSLNYSVSYGSAGSKTSTGTSVGTASAPYCTVVASYSPATTVKAPSVFYTAPEVGVYKANYYYQPFETAVNNWSATDKADTLAAYTSWANGYKSLEANRHTASTNDAWANSMKNDLYSVSGGYTMYVDTLNSNYLFSSSPVINGVRRNVQVLVPKGGDSSKFSVFMDNNNFSSTPPTTNGTVYLNAGYFGENGAAGTLGMYTTTLIGSARYYAFTTVGSASCK